jgi:hypothetical protein
MLHNIDTKTSFERTARMPYFTTDGEIINDKITLLQQKNYICYTCDSEIVGTNIFVLDGTTLSYFFDRSHQRGSTKKQVLFKVSNADFTSIGSMLLHAQLPLFPPEDRVLQDTEMISTTINQSSVVRVGDNGGKSGVYRISHHKYEILDAKIDSSNLSITSNGEVVYEFRRMNDNEVRLTRGNIDSTIDRCIKLGENVFDLTKDKFKYNNIIIHQ